MAPTEREEICVAGLNMLIGLVLAAFFICTAATLFTENERAEFAKREVIELVCEGLRFRKTPKYIMDKVDSYFDKKLQKYPPTSESKLLEKLSFSLRTQILMSNCEKLFDSVPMFKKIPQVVKIDLLGRLEFEVYLKGDVIITEDNVADGMFFIEEGSVEVLTPFSLTDKVLSSGDFFGEIALITKGHRLATVVAKTDCDVYRLKKKDFEECLEPRPEVLEMVMSVAKKRLDEDCREQEAMEKRIQEAEAWKQLKGKKVKEKRKELDFMKSTLEKHETVTSDWEGFHEHTMKAAPLLVNEDMEQPLSTDRE